MTFDARKHTHDGSVSPDRTASMRTLVIPHMKAHGRSLAEIAAITHVPPALVELIPAQPCTGHGGPAIHDGPPVTVSPKAAGAAEGPVGTGPSVPWHTRHRKLVVGAVTASFLAAAAVVSIVLRAPLLPLAAMVIGGWLGPRRL